MTNKQLIFVAVVINILLMFLLVHKQNKIIKQLYELQQLDEQKNILRAEKKDLTLNLHKLTQLSTMQEYATSQLHMKPMKLKDAKTVPKPDENIDGATSK